MTNIQITPASTPNKWNVFRSLHPDRTPQPLGFVQKGVMNMRVFYPLAEVGGMTPECLRQIAEMMEGI